MPGSDLTHAACALILAAAGGLAQTAAGAQTPAHDSPVTITLHDALALAEKNDPGLLAAAGDAAAAREDRKQARAALYPSLSGRSEYLGTEGNGKLAESRFVTNDGVHVYRDWAVVHHGFVAWHAARNRRASRQRGGGAGARQAGNRAARAGRHGH